MEVTFALDRHEISVITPATDDGPQARISEQLVTAVCTTSSRTQCRAVLEAGATKKCEEVDRVTLREQPTSSTSPQVQVALANAMNVSEGKAIDMQSAE